MQQFSVLAAGLIGGAFAQQPGTQSPAEVHPTITYEECTKDGCTQKSGGIVLDSNWRWTDQAGQNCYKGNSWDKTKCPDPTTCASTCALEGAAYEATYGITTEANTVKLNFVTHGQYGSNVGSRTYLMEDEDSYQIFHLKNKEFSFDVDVSQLDCGLNGALYFVEMDKDGGMSKFPGNKAGAKYGTGYCDAQCPHDIKYINGEANILNWNSTDENSGTGKYGSCCFEMDIWEANKHATAYTPHNCDRSKVVGQTRCSGLDCGDGQSDKDSRYEGFCDKDGCDFSAFRLGEKNLFGAGSEFEIDTTKKVTVVTQFVTHDNTDTGDLVEIRRKYIQNGKVIRNPSVTVNGKSHDSITDAYCKDEKLGFKDPHDDFTKHGGLKAMGKAFDNGMVLVMSLWDDHAVNMLWLDSDYPLTSDPTAPGVKRGPCSRDSGKPADVEQQQANAYVEYSNVKSGPFCSTNPDPEDKLCKTVKQEEIIV